MRPIIRSYLLAFIFLTAYFVVGSLISDNMRFPYGYVSAGAIILFLLTGYLFARHGTVGGAALATGISGLDSSVAAWLILSFLSPLRHGDPKPVPDAIGEVVVLMTVAAILLGAIGALAGRKRAA
ncbi:MAG: hypothetical protein ABI679_03335 [Gemmatimonadota bacterium]